MINNAWVCFKTTDKEVEQIKKGNFEAIRKFFEDNQEIITKFCYSAMARRWSLWGKHYDNINDCLAQVYIDIPNYNFSKYDIGIIRGVWRSATYCNDGGYYYYKSKSVKKYCSLDAPLTSDSSFCLYNVISDKSDFISEIEKTLENRLLFEKTVDKISKILFPNSETLRKQFIQKY